MAITHADIYPYTNPFPIAAGQVMIDTLRRTGGHDTACLVHAGWALVGYALGQVLPDQHEMQAPPPLTAASCADILEHQMMRHEGVGAITFNWKQVASFLVAMLAEWLKQ